MSLTHLSHGLTQIREGMTVLTPLPPGPNSSLDRSILLSIFSAVGRARVLDEKYFDACTALAGSGPAFACVFLEAMADGGESALAISLLHPRSMKLITCTSPVLLGTGVMMGLPRAEALELAAQSMHGAAQMVLESGMHPAALKDSVTSECAAIPYSRVSFMS
jgi:pyrroline-5-carboxylate reductase